jgi:hypothetical protein
MTPGELANQILKPQTANHCRFSLAPYIIPALGDRRLDDISDGHSRGRHGLGLAR